jgi:septal ring factor EnvC (AmiA/AmiB activator)
LNSKESKKSNEKQRQTIKMVEKDAHAQFPPTEQLDEMAEQLGDQEDRYNGMAKGRKKLEADMEALKRQIGDMDATIRRHESEKLTKDTQIRSLQVHT